MNLERKFYKQLFLKYSFEGLFLIIIIIGLAFNLLRDYTESLINQSSYYFSESLLFSSFWWWFIPLFIVQSIITKKEHLFLRHKLLLYGSLIIGHLIIAGFFIDIVSNTFYEQRFTFLKVIGYSFTENAYLLIVLYGIPFLFIKKRNKMGSEIIEAKKELTTSTNLPSSSFVSHLLITEGKHKVSICVNDIIFISSCPPYVNIHTSKKKYLHKITLGKIHQCLNPDRFVRIHKSAIVNVAKVNSFCSRHNGDYDIIIQDQPILRLSRNYTNEFKRVMGIGTQLNV